MTSDVGADRKVALVTGVGPGLGAALCRKLANNGYAVAALARSQTYGETFERELRDGGAEVRFIPCDVTDATAVQQAVSHVETLWQPVSVLVHNAAALLIQPFTETSPQDFERLWRVICLGGMLTAGAVLPAMQARGEGAILFTGATASRRGGAKFAAFASAKFALRGLAQSLAREHGPDGIHVAHVVVDGLIWGRQSETRFKAERDSCLEPDAIAEAYLQLIGQDRSAWSQEIDLRPSSERF